MYQYREMDTKNALIEGTKQECESGETYHRFTGFEVVEVSNKL